ncbi:hypothetical protein DXG01_006637 [Tephrocybe rancida]|nr:hypothetical protein DXG01_006637 [Tephrocybe rancida]
MLQIWPWLTLTLLTTSVLARSLAEDCGNGSVIKQTTLRAGGHDVAVITRECPGRNKAASPSIGDSIAAANNVEKCDKSGDACALKCNGTQAQPDELDCDALVVALNRVPEDTFTAPPLTATGFSIGSCRFSYTNYDQATQALATSVVCRANSSPAMLTGQCVAPGGANNTWLIE